MGDLFKKNWKRVTGVRGEDPLDDLEITRLKDIIAGSGSGGGGPLALGGDLGGTTAAAVVEGLQGFAVASTTPSRGELLKWDGAEWAPAADEAGSGGSSLGAEYRIEIPAGASLAAKIAGAVLPAGWTIVLANDGSVDAEIAATANDIVLIHGTGAWLADIRIHELDTNAAPLGGYYVINDSAVSPLSKSNQTGSQFSVLNFSGLVTLTRRQLIYVKLLSV